ncbi:uncharacterized protein ARMOST_20229 [Armillaria ostoyae]|uniref:Uncharacterized protein n=1 Tax=Armillaria ostoyae TaxID=47428 RepID=A0A284S6S3_ARMOS|nr:uncharacterized protein ARMOST_20229 [Armillaria ostoyae]
MFVRTPAYDELEDKLEPFHRRTWTAARGYQGNSPSVAPFLEADNSNNEYNLICDDAAMALRRSSKTVGQGIDAPTTTINTGTTSIVTIRNVEFMDNPTRFSYVSRYLGHRPDHGSGSIFGYSGREMAVW